MRESILQTRAPLVVPFYKARDCDLSLKCLIVSPLHGVKTAYWPLANDNQPSGWVA